MKLPSSIASQQDLAAVILEVRDYARWFNHAAVKMEVTGAQIPVPPSLSPGANELINTGASPREFQQKKLDDLITALEHVHDEAPVMTITLAALASGELRQQLVAWCRQNIGQDVLVNFAFNSTILGGMVVHWGSHIFDWSFRREILAASHNFAEVLRRV